MDQSLPEIQRRLSSEFSTSTDFDTINQKTSAAKKTCRALSVFFDEFCQIEQTYANSLANLSKNGTTSLLGVSYSLLIYKNKEESYFFIGNEIL